MLLEIFAKERQRREIQFVTNFADGLLGIEPVVRDGLHGAVGDPVKSSALSNCTAKIQKNPYPEIYGLW
jgi:uncharacterized protein (DUF1786 family)